MRENIMLMLQKVKKSDPTTLSTTFIQRASEFNIQRYIFFEYSKADKSIKLSDKCKITMRYYEKQAHIHFSFLKVFFHRLCTISREKGLLPVALVTF